MQDPYSEINPLFPEQQILKCPRCDSNNTKFCYYNNYNLSQPRHFCKNCKRYWTKGGILRNIPVGGGSRKITKRSSSNPKNSSPTSTSTSPPSSLTAQSQPEPDSSGVGAVDRDDGRFSSSGGQFGDFINMGSGPNSDKSGIENDDALGNWKSGNGWPALSIFTSPGSNFQ